MGSMLPYIAAPWILWVMFQSEQSESLPLLLRSRSRAAPEILRSTITPEYILTHPTTAYHSGHSMIWAVFLISAGCSRVIESCTLRVSPPGMGEGLGLERGAFVRIWLWDVDHHFPYQKWPLMAIESSISWEWQCMAVCPIFRHNHVAWWQPQLRLAAQDLARDRVYVTTWGQVLVHKIRANLSCFSDLLWLICKCLQSVSKCCSKIVCWPQNHLLQAGCQKNTS